MGSRVTSTKHDSQILTGGENLAFWSKYLPVNSAFHVFSIVLKGRNRRNREEIRSHNGGGVK